MEVGGEELDVVVRGATVPAEARAGARLLGNWINDDNARTGDWKPFTSDDPDEDGWRWAAINQKTGTVIYIR